MVDRILSVLFLLVLGLPMALILLVVRCVDGPPAIFKQQRMGLNGQAFTLLKFRTMAVDTPDAWSLGPVGFNHHYVTPLGRYLRRFRLDELPQFLNVVRGEMALVGPRPRLLEPSELPSVNCRLILSVKPGLTGLAEVSGNLLLDDEEQVALDLYFIRHNSIKLSIRILLTTVMVILVGPRRHERIISKAKTELLT